MFRVLPNAPRLSTFSTASKPNNLFARPFTVSSIVLGKKGKKIPVFANEKDSRNGPEDLDASNSVRKLQNLEKGGNGFETGSLLKLLTGLMRHKGLPGTSSVHTPILRPSVDERGGGHNFQTGELRILPNDINETSKHRGKTQGFTNIGDGTEPTFTSSLSRRLKPTGKITTSLRNASRRKNAASPTADLMEKSKSARVQKSQDLL